MQMPESLNEEVVPIMAKWWADLLRRNLPFDHGGPMSRVENNIFQSVTQMRQRDVTPEHCDAFERVLADCIREGFSRRIRGFQDGLSVDYHPTVLLKKALEYAHVPYPDDILPAKVDMDVSPISVTVMGPHIKKASERMLWKAYETLEIDQVEIVGYEESLSFYLDDPPLRFVDGEVAYITIVPSLNARRVALVPRGILQDGFVREENWLSQVGYAFHSLGLRGFLAAIKIRPETPIKVDSWA